LRELDFADELFECLHNLSVGFERLLNIAVVLHEHIEAGDQTALEQSLITHSHLDLVVLPSAGTHYLDAIACFPGRTMWGFTIASNAT
jgi:hypothetical protein